MVGGLYSNEFGAAPSPDGATLAFCAGGAANRDWWRKGHAHWDESQIWLRCAPESENVMASSGQVLQQPNSIHLARVHPHEQTRPANIRCSATTCRWAVGLRHANAKMQAFGPVRPDSS